MAPRTRNLLYAGAVVAVGGAFALLPLYFGKNIKRNLSTSDAPLSGQAVMRGPYINSGSVDVGPDPNWVFIPGQGRVFVGQRNAPSAQDVERFRGELAAKRATAAAQPAAQ